MPILMPSSRLKCRQTLPVARLELANSKQHDKLFPQKSWLAGFCSSPFVFFGLGAVFTAAGHCALLRRQRSPLELPPWPHGDKANTTTVFIGSSRIKYDLDVATWRSLTGDEPVELAHEGSTPTPVLHHLANDTAFKGKLVIDVTEGLFFAPGGPPFETPNKSIAYYNGLTPAQRVGFQLNSALESQLVFLDKDYFSLNALLNKIRVPKRANVFAMPDFPRDFGPNNFDRQNVMTAKFLADSNQINQVRGIWQFFASLPSPPPISGAALDSFIMGIAASTNKIKARGGTVVFVRTP